MSTLFTPVMLTMYELSCGDTEYYLHSREGDEILLVDLDPVAARIAEAIKAQATGGYTCSLTLCHTGEVVKHTTYLFD